MNVTLSTTSLLVTKINQVLVCGFVQVYEWLGRSVICRDIMAKLLVAF